MRELNNAAIEVETTYDDHHPFRAAEQHVRSTIILQETERLRRRRVVIVAHQRYDDHIRFISLEGVHCAAISSVRERRVQLL